MAGEVKETWERPQLRFWRAASNVAVGHARHVVAMMEEFLCLGGRHPRCVQSLSLRTRFQREGWLRYHGACMARRGKLGHRMVQHDVCHSAA
eukprot:364892-Chlamydomonas_euryale.AAC.5